MNTVSNKLQVRHFPQVPCKPFCVDVDGEKEAKKIKDILANQHLFLFDEKIIPDYSNAIIVMMWDNENKEWVDYWNEEEIMDWDEFEETYLNK